MASYPGTKADFFFGDPDKDPLPDWRKHAQENPAHDDEDATPDEKAATKAVLRSIGLNSARDNQVGRERE